MAYSPDQDCLKCFAINHFGTGQHPMAVPTNLYFFTDSYIRECVKKAVDSGKITDHGKKLAAEILGV